MSWKKFWKFLKSIWGKIVNCKTSTKNNTSLDTVSLKLFGLDLKVTREVPIGVPYELTVVIPRAECRECHGNKNNNREIILSSITIAHSPRFETCSQKPNKLPAL